MENSRKLVISEANNRLSKQWVTSEITWSEFVERLGKPKVTAETPVSYTHLKFVCLRNFNSCENKIWTAILEDLEIDKNKELNLCKTLSL